jgi:hypothetical protein
MKNWMTRQIMDDTTHKPFTALLALFTYEGRLPQVVSCGPSNYQGEVTLTVVMENEDGMYLSTKSVCFLKEAQLKELKDTGFVKAKNGNLTVQLIEAPPVVLSIDAFYSDCCNYEHCTC